jgi:hypothetical protein
MGFRGVRLKTGTTVSVLGTTEPFGTDRNDGLGVHG